jgi:NitT/TauT family transport system ATP-binding protein
MLDLRIERKSFAAPDGSRRVVLRDIAFSVKQGEAVGLLGASGTGKSTTLRILLGLDTAFTGEVRRGAGRIGVMFQEPRLLPWLTVADNLRLVVADGMPAPDIVGLLDEVQLPDVGSLYPRQLSVGMARRVALARALAASPAMLVLDEPFASLDPQVAATIVEVVARWARRAGGAVVLATHDLTQALGLLSRVLVLSGTPATLAADWRVTDDGDRAALRGRLVGTFGFLGTADCEPMEP